MAIHHRAVSCFGECKADIGQIAGAALLLKRVWRSPIISVYNFLHLLSSVLLLLRVGISLCDPSYSARKARSRITNQEREIRLTRLVGVIGDRVESRLPRSLRRYSSAC